MPSLEKLTYTSNSMRAREWTLAEIKADPPESHAQSVPYALPASSIGRLHKPISNNFTYMKQREHAFVIGHPDHFPSSGIPRHQADI
ncbi:MAG: hypothetical protein ABJF07_24395 [Nisaea sp.]|uniref:hypothetical protein n=1 Tax=Nisaea sp. TaxID=2024842 RepID=UPI00326539F0